MTRREALMLLAAAPLMNLKEAYDNLQAEKKRFEFDLDDVHVKAEWDENRKDFVIILSRPVYYSNLSMLPNEACERSQIFLKLDAAKRLADWIQAL